MPCDLTPSLLFASNYFHFCIESESDQKQAGAELGQAQLQLELGFTLIKVCCITLMITN